MDSFDVAIVGAGPAGSRAAWRLARGGARVALVDGSHPREKACGGGVTGRALELVADGLPRDAPGVRIETAVFAHGDRSTRMRLDGPRRLVVMSRRRFDGALVAAATGEGATLVAARATDVRRAADRWTIETTGGSLSAPWIIGADGPNSLVRRRVSSPFPRADLSVASGFFVHGASSSEIAIAFEDRPAGYLWSFPRPDHLAVGVCAQADESSPRVLLPIAREWIARNMDTHACELQPYNWPIPSLRPASLLRERPCGAGWMLVGDAAGMVDPITREGIFFALVSADAAASSLLAGRDPAREYERQARARVYAELVRAARLKARFYRAQFMGLLITALERSDRVRAIMADLVSGDQPYRGLHRRLIATGELGLMVKLFTRRD